MSGRNIEIGMSNLNLSLKDTALLHGDDYVRQLLRGGYDLAGGFEWTHIRTPRAYAAGKFLGQIGMVPVVHQSWREVTVRQLPGVAKREGVAAAARVVPEIGAFPLLDRSYKALGKIAGGHTAAKPIILHPYGQQLGGRPQSRPRSNVDGAWLGPRWMQPTAEWLVTRGVDPARPSQAELVEEIGTHAFLSGHNGLALDLHHLSAERNGFFFHKPVELAALLAASGQVKEVQVSLRPDFGGSPDEVNETLEGRFAGTRMGEMLGATLSNMPRTDEPIRVVTEIRAASIGVHDYMGAHQAITDGIREVAAAA